MLRPISFAAAIALTSQRPEGWNYWHDHRHLISGAELIVDGKVVKELTVDGEQRSQDIVPLVRESTEAMVLHALNTGHSVELQAPDTPVVARAHPIWLGEVLNNLLDNAQRYGGRHIRMLVRAVPEGGAEVVVEDDGPGVAPDQVARLFEPFWRGDRADTRSDGGTGLGLAIAREIVDRLGGSLTAESRPQFDGMRFVLRLQP